MARLQKQGQITARPFSSSMNTHDQRVEFVYEGIKSNYQKQQRISLQNQGELVSQTSLESFVAICNKVLNEPSNKGKCTSRDDCLHCERVRRVRYMKARRTDPDTKSRYY